MALTVSGEGLLELTFAHETPGANDIGHDIDLKHGRR
jgi:hypothetical protein